MYYDKTQACGTLAGSGVNDPLTLWILADPHYLSTKLFDLNAASFQRLLEHEAGRLIERMPQVMESFVKRAVQQKPDAVLLPGDLTLNGELISLQEIREYLEQIRQAGIDVLVIPGNHDIEHPRAGSYTQQEAGDTPSVTKSLFWEEMKRFGYADSISQAPDSFSYCYPIRDDLRILALDANTKDMPCALTDSTLHWAEEQLADAQKNGCAVISISHQNILIQDKRMERGFVMNNHREVVRLLQKYGVKLHLSGHAHLQSYAMDNDLYDICTECAAVSPLGFGVLEISGDHNKWSYHRSLFELYQEEAEQRMHRTVKRMLAGALPEGLYTEAEQNCMMKLGTELVVSYFAGNICSLESPERKADAERWLTQSGQNDQSDYIVSIIEREEQCHKELQNVNNSH